MISWPFCFSINAGSIRGSLERGAVSESIVLQALPFLNEVHKLPEISGLDIRKAIQHSLYALR